MQPFFQLFLVLCSLSSTLRSFLNVYPISGYRTSTLYFTGIIPKHKISSHSHSFPLFTVSKSCISRFLASTTLGVHAQPLTYFATRYFLSQFLRTAEGLAARSTLKCVTSDLALDYRMNEADPSVGLCSSDQPANIHANCICYQQ